MAWTSSGVAPVRFDPAELLKWKLLLGTETCSIASGPNAVANLLDMTIFVTVTRRGLEEYWQPKVFGESALPMLDTCRNAETNIWQFTGQVLTPAQLRNLKKGSTPGSSRTRCRRTCSRRAR